MDAYTEQILIQIGVGLVLTFLLRQLFLKLRPEPFLAYWSLYWFDFSVYLGVALCYQRTAPAAVGVRVLCSSIGFVLWVFQPLLMLLAALALTELRLSRRIERLTLVAAGSVAAVVGVILFLKRAPISAVPLLSPMRFLLHAAALAYFAWAFGHSRHRARAIGVQLTVLFCGGYALHMLAHSLS